LSKTGGFGVFGENMAFFSKLISAQRARRGLATCRVQSKGLSANTYSVEYVCPKSRIFQPVLDFPEGYLVISSLYDIN
jgi:hypothetical protein